MELNEKEIKKIERVNYNIEHKTSSQDTHNLICNLPDTRIKSSDYKNIYTSNNEKVSEFSKPKIMSIGSRRVYYINDIYTKEFYQNNSIKKEEIVKLFFKEKLNVNINDFYKDIDFEKIKKEISTDDIYNFFINNSEYFKKTSEEFNKYKLNIDKFIEENYNDIFKKIMQDVFKSINFNDLLTDQFFNNSNVYLNDFIDVIINSIIPFIRKNNLGNLSSEVIRLIFSNVLIFSNNQNFGICYKTKKRIAEELLYSQRTVQKAMDKLEYLGIIDYVVADKKHVSKDLSNYIEELEDIKKKHVIDEELKKIKRELEYEIFKQQKVLEFPCINWKMVIHYIDSFIAKNRYREMKFELEKSFKKFATEMIIKIIKEKRDLSDIVKDFNIEKCFTIYNNTGKMIRMNEKVKFDLLELYNYFEEKLCEGDNYFEEKCRVTSEKIEEYVLYEKERVEEIKEFKSIPLSKIISSSFVNNLKIKDVMASFMLDYNKDYENIKNIELNDENKKIIKGFKSSIGINNIIQFTEANNLKDEFNKYFIEKSFASDISESIYSRNSRLLYKEEVNANEINEYTFNYIMNTLKQSVVDTWKYENGYEYNTFKIMYSRDEESTMYRNNLVSEGCEVEINNLEKLNNMIKTSNTLTPDDKLNIYKSLFPIDILFKTLLKKSEKPMEFMTDWYKLTMNRNKGIFIYLGNLSKIFQKYLIK